MNVRNLLLAIVSGGAVVAPMPAGAQTFREVADRLDIEHYCLDHNRVCGGVAFFDYNNDGLEDLYLTGGEERDRLYENTGDGEFRDVTGRAKLGFMKDINTVGAVTGDIDNDGDRDIFVTTAEGFADVLLRNNGDGTFTDISEAAGFTEQEWSMPAAFGDYNLDGFIDLYVGNYATYDALPYDENLTGGIPNVLYRNNGDNTFEDVTETAGVENPDGATLVAAFTDVDGDHDVDLYVGNDFGYLFSPNALFLNEFPSEAFTDVSELTATDTAINAMGIAVGDFDEDGDFDYYITNMKGNVLYENRGPGERFGESAEIRGMDDLRTTSWGAAFFDYDNDTYLDLVVAQGRVLTRYDMTAYDHVERLIRSHDNRLYRGDGQAGFVDVSRAEGVVVDSTKGRGLAYADFDHDGDLDFAVGVVREEKGDRGEVLFFRNESENDNHWLKVQLQGTTVNRDAFGSHLRLVIGDRSWIREIGGGTSYLSQNSSIAHFGLGSHTRADSLIVTWLGGKREVFTDLASDRLFRIVEGTSIETVEIPRR